MGRVVTCVAAGSAVALTLRDAFHLIDDAIIGRVGQLTQRLEAQAGAHPRDHCADCACTRGSGWPACQRSVGAGYAAARPAAESARGRRRERRDWVIIGTHALSSRPRSSSNLRSEGSRAI